MSSVLARYEAFIVRRTTPRLGEERARREAPAQARFTVVLLPWTFEVAAAPFVRMAGMPGIALLMSVVGIAWSPVVVIAWMNLRRARKPGSGALGLGNPSSIGGQSGEIPQAQIGDASFVMGPTSHWQQPGPTTSPSSARSRTQLAWSIAFVVMFAVGLFVGAANPSVDAAFGGLAIPASLAIYLGGLGIAFLLARWMRSRGRGPRRPLAIVLYGVVVGWLCSFLVSFAIVGVALVLGFAARG